MDFGPDGRPDRREMLSGGFPGRTGEPRGTGTVASGPGRGAVDGHEARPTEAPGKELVGVEIRGWTPPPWGPGDGPDPEEQQRSASAAEHLAGRDRVTRGD